MSKQATLRRGLGLREAITITAGTVIGVGLFTVGGNVVGLTGPAVLLASLAALAVSVYPALLYAEMGAALPGAGGTYQYASRGLGRPLGFLAGWNFVVSMVSVASGEALAFSFYLRTLLEAFGLRLPLGDRAVAVLAVAAFLLLGVRGVEMTGRMQNGFLFFFWGVAAVWTLAMLPRLHFQNFAPAAGAGPGGFLPCVAMVWWCFAGFETCCAMGEEIRYPQVNLPRALFLAPFIVFAVNGLFQWALLCIVPPDGLAALAAAGAPYAEGMRRAGIVGLPLALLCAGIAFGGDFSTLNAGVAAPARYLYTMARDGALPAVFARIHPRFQTPWVALAALGGLMIVLIATGSIALIASLSLFATLLYYIIGIAAACGLRLRCPELARPWRAPGIRAGAPVSAAAYLLLMTQLDRAAVAAGTAFCAAGLALYALQRRRGPVPAPGGETDPPPPAPGARERESMDRSYRLWRAAVAAAVLLVLALYAAAFILARRPA